MYWDANPVILCNNHESVRCLFVTDNEFSSPDTVPDDIFQKVEKDGLKQGIGIDFQAIHLDLP